MECSFWQERKTLREPCVIVILEKWHIATEKMIKNYWKCVFHNVITRMGRQWPKRKLENWFFTSNRSIIITGTLCGSHTRKVSQFHYKNEQKKGHLTECEKKNVTVQTTEQWEWVISDLKGSNKVECPLRNNRKAL